MIVVTAEPAYSYMKVARDVAEVLRSHFDNVVYVDRWSYFRPPVGKVLIVVGSVSAFNHMLIKYFEKVIVYFDVPLIPALPQIVRQNYNRIRHRAMFVVNSRYMWDVAERHIGIVPDVVIHHGSDVGYVPHASRRDGTITVAFYSARKGLHYVRHVAQRLTRHQFTVVTNRHVPDLLHLPNVMVLACAGEMSREHYIRLVTCHRSYLCTSLHEGFCLPVLESLCMGLVAVVPDRPPFTEYVPEWALRYGTHLDVDRLVQVSKFETIPYCEHDVDDMVRKVEMSQHVTVSRHEVIKYADRWNIYNVYSRFVELIR